MIGRGENGSWNSKEYTPSECSEMHIHFLTMHIESIAIMCRVSIHGGIWVAGQQDVARLRLVIVVKVASRCWAYDEFEALVVVCCHFELI